MGTGVQCVLQRMHNMTAETASGALHSEREMCYTPDEAPTADSVSGDHSHWPSRQHRGTIGASDRLM